MREFTLRRRLAAGWCLVAWLSLALCLSHSSTAQEQLTVEAVFNQRGVSGTVVFVQDSLYNSSRISVNLTGRLYDTGCHASRDM